MNTEHLKLPHITYNEGKKFYELIGLSVFQGEIWNTIVVYMASKGYLVLIDEKYNITINDYLRQDCREFHNFNSFLKNLEFKLIFDLI